jgi:DNA-binding SARP family transcriptional activator/predicted ATPase
MMDAPLTVYTLGRFAILRHGRPLTGLSSRTAEALLIYLMRQTRPLSRQVIADFLWDDRATDRAAANLRTLLTMMRKELGEYLIIDRYSVGFNHASDFWLDVAELEQQLAALTPVIQTAVPLTGEQAMALQTAVDLYQGPFLDGFYLSESRGFDEWLSLTQERLRHQVERGLRRLVAHYLESGQYETGRPYAARLLALDPYNEVAHRQLMWLLVRSGQRHAALEQYQQCRRLLLDELGVEPAPATTAVYTHIRALEFPPPCHLPRADTPLIGREGEVTAVSQQLAQPDCRLLSLLGPGGVGKTRLAMEAAHRLWQQRPGQFLHGVYFVSLAGIDAVPQIPLLLAEKLAVSLRGPAAPLTQLLNYLHDKEMLLILDNVEHLLERDAAEMANLLAQLLAGAGQIKLLVTSRTRLNLREEWLVDVRGLDYPSPGRVADAAAYGAPGLFLHHARRMRHDFVPVTADWQAITHLCQLLEGLPLGLELAAAWVRHATCTEIVAQVAAQPAALVSGYYNVPERHRSLTAVFDYSWKLLSAAEQHMLPRLTLFRDGFTQAAAMSVAQADPTTLHGLVDKSLLRREADGRYNIHPLLRQLSAAHLTSEEEAATAEAHARYYADLIQAQESSLDGPQAETLLAALRRERANLLAAWEWALAHRAVPLLGQMAGGLAYLDDTQGAFVAGYERCTAVTGEWLAATDAGRLLAGRCRVYQGRFAHQLGRFEEAEALYREGVEGLRPLPPSPALALALTYWGELARQQGDLAAARPRHEESLALFRQWENAQGTARALLHLANLAFVSGQLPDAARQYEEGLAICQTLGSYRQTAVFLDNLGAVRIELGEYEAAEQTLTAALARRQAINDQWGLATSNNNLGVLAGLRGQYAEAEKRYQAAADAYRQIGYAFGVARCLTNLGSMLISQGKLETARHYLAEALALWQPLDSPEGEADALLCLGQAASQQGQYAEAEGLLRRAATLFRQCDRSISLMRTLADWSVVLGRLEKLAEARAALAESLALAETASSPPGLLWALMAGADLRAQAGELAGAAVWFDVVQGHAQTTQPVRAEAARLRQHWSGIPARRDQAPALAQVLAELRQFLDGAQTLRNG